MRVVSLVGGAAPFPRGRGGGPTDLDAEGGAERKDFRVSRGVSRGARRNQTKGRNETGDEASRRFECARLGVCVTKEGLSAPVSLGEIR